MISLILATLVGCSSEEAPKEEVKPAVEVAPVATEAAPPAPAVEATPAATTEAPVNPQITDAVTTTPATTTTGASK